MDLMLWCLQIIGLTLSYVNNLAHSLPNVPQLPYDDLLLPTEPDYDSDLEGEEFDLERGVSGDDEDLDPEEDKGENGQLWLDDEPGPSRPRKGQRSLACRSV